MPMFPPSSNENHSKSWRGICRLLQCDITAGEYVEPPAFLDGHWKRGPGKSENSASIIRLVVLISNLGSTSMNVMVPFISLRP